jgi:hypothetical protein
MKKFKIFITLCLVATASFFVASCKKDGVSSSSSVQPINEDFDYVDNRTISEDEDTEIQVDEIYDTEGLNPTITFDSTGTTAVKAGNSDADGNCTKFEKYEGKGVYKVGHTGKTFKLTLSSNAVIDSIVNTNTNTGKYAKNADAALVGGRLEFFDLAATSTGTGSLVKLKTQLDSFKYGSAKMTVYMRVKEKDTSTTYTQAKIRNVTVKVVGLAASGAMYGTQKYAYQAADGSTANYTATPTAIDSNYVPAKGDVLVFGGATGNQRGVISSTPVVTAATTAAQLVKGTKYQFEYVIGNADCKGSRSVKKATIYRKVAPLTTPVTDGQKLTHYKR